MQEVTSGAERKLRVTWDLLDTVQRYLSKGGCARFYRIRCKEAIIAALSSDDIAYLDESELRRGEINLKTVLRLRDEVRAREGMKKPDARPSRTSKNAQK